MNKEELKRQLKEKEDERKSISYEMGKVFNKRDKNYKELQECNSALKLTKYAVAILSLVSATIFVSIINSFNIVFLFFNILFVLGDILAIKKLKKFNKQFKQLKKERVELTESANNYYQQVSGLETIVQKIKNQIESCQTDETTTNISNKNSTISDNIDDTVQP